MSDPLYYENTSFLLCSKQFQNDGLWKNDENRSSSYSEHTIDDSISLAPILNDLSHESIKKRESPRLPGVSSIIALTNLAPPSPHTLLQSKTLPYSHYHIPSSPLSTKAMAAVESETIAFPVSKHNYLPSQNSSLAASFVQNVPQPHEAGIVPIAGEAADIAALCLSSITAASSNGRHGDFAPKMKLPGFTEEELADYELHYNDYQCGVSTFRSTACKRNLSCKSHPLEQKLLVPRSKPFEQLINQERTNLKEVARKRKLYKQINLAKQEHESIRNGLSGAEMPNLNPNKKTSLPRLDDDFIQVSSSSHGLKLKGHSESKSFEPHDFGFSCIHPDLIEQVGGDQRRMFAEKSEVSTGTSASVGQSNFIHIDRYENFPEPKNCPSSILYDKSCDITEKALPFFEKPKTINTRQIFKILRRITTKNLSQKELYIHSLSRTTAVNIDETVAYLHYRLKGYRG